MSQQVGGRKGKVVLGEALQCSLRSSLDWRCLYIYMYVYIFISNVFFVILGDCGQGMMGRGDVW